MKIIGYVTVTIIAAVFAQIANGFAIVMLWEWFIVPLFDVRPLTIPSAIGLSIVSSYLTHQISSKPDDRPFCEALLAGIICAVLKPAFAIMLGWPVSLFINL